VELEARIATVRMAETFVISRGASDAAEVVDVELRHEGVSGFGEAAPIERYDESPVSALAFLEDAGELVGDDPFALEAIEARLRERPGEQAAKAGLDAALHDLCGKLVGLPVWRLLGLERAGPPTSWTVWLGDPDDMAQRAERVGGRFKRLKLKIGGGDGLDVERVRAVRGVSEVPLQVDVNEAWSLDEALEALPQLAELGVEYCEQPLPAGDSGDFLAIKFDRDFFAGLARAPHRPGADRRPPMSRATPVRMAWRWTAPATSMWPMQAISAFRSSRPMARPSSFPQRAVPRPWRPETPDALPSPILRRLSRPRHALLRGDAANSCCWRAMLACPQGVFGGCAPEGAALK
jgi:hypothetical protein